MNFNDRTNVFANASWSRGITIIIVVVAVVGYSRLFSNISRNFSNVSVSMRILYSAIPVRNSR